VSRLVRRERPERHRRRWTPEEDRRVLAAQRGELRAVAEELGRTWRRVVVRRWQLRRPLRLPYVRWPELEAWLDQRGRRLA
jgi:hypothetical protein